MVVREYQYQNRRKNHRTFSRRRRLLNISRHIILIRFISSSSSSSPNHTYIYAPTLYIFAYFSGNSIRIENYFFASSLNLLCIKIARSCIRTHTHTHTHCFFQQQGFDEYMNLTLDDAEKLDIKKQSRKKLGKILLKGDNITLMMNADGGESK